jgi:LysR family transcriptional regulator, cyn operon transcriptional activator
MELRHLRYFAALAETGSFRGTALRLNVSQPTLSHQIRQLESTLGTALFNRAKHGVDLTAAGTAFRPYCVRILSEIELGVRAVADLDSLVRGSVRMGVLHSFSRSLLGPILARFAVDCPGIRVITQLLAQLEMERRVINGQLDFAVAYSSEDSDHIVGEELFEDDLVLVVGRKHPLAKVKAIEIRDLPKVKLILLTRECAARDYLDRIFSKGFGVLDVALEMNSVEPILATVRQSSLSTVLSPGAVAGTAGVRCIPLVNPIPKRVVGILWRRIGHRSSAAVRLASMIPAAYSELRTRANRTR